MIKVELDKEDLICLVNGVDFSYIIPDLARKYGTWTGGFVDKWDWEKEELRKLTEEQLLELYNECRKVIRK